jgi:hypothetical protein
MVATILDKVQGWIEGADVRRVIPGLMQPIDVKAIARELDLAGRGRERGSREVPPSTDDNFDQVEQSIVDRVSAERTVQHGHLVTMLRAYRDRLAELIAGVEIEKLRLEAKAALSRIDQARHEVRGELARLERAFVEAHDELEAFRQRHRLTRPARNPDNRGVTGGLLVVCIAVESVLNGFFFAKGSDLGLLGGIGTAIGISVVNVVGCFLLGWGPARLRNARNWFLKLTGYLVSLAGIGGFLLLHLFAGHFRDATATFGEERAFEIASTRLWTEPWALSDISSWYLFGLGALFGLVSMWKGYGMDDPYPHYGATFRRARKAEKEYDEEHRHFFGDLENVRDSTIEKFRAGISNIPQYAAKTEQVRTARTAMVEEFRVYEPLLEQAANHLLSIYRESNVRYRKSAAPPHFNRNWKLPESALSSPEVKTLLIDPRDTAFSNVEATLAELRESSNAVILAYNQVLAAVRHPSDMR